MKFKTFDFEGTKIRVGFVPPYGVVIVAEDICELFGYVRLRHTTHMLKEIDAAGCGIPKRLYTNRTTLRERVFANVISVEGAWAAALDGIDPDEAPDVAVRFRRWLVDVVLPLEHDHSFKMLTLSEGVGDDYRNDYRFATREEVDQYVCMIETLDIKRAMCFIQEMEAQREGYMHTYGKSAFKKAENDAREWLKVLQERRAELQVI